MAENVNETVDQNVPETEEVKEQEVQTEEKAEKPGRKERKEIEAMKEKLAEAEKKAAEAEEKAAKEHDTYVRLYAEFENYRRRTSQEKLDIVSVASKDTIIGLLPVLDDFERAIDALAKTEGHETAKEGTEMIYNKLMGYLKGKGLAVIECKGQAFDTEFHEAIAQFPAPSEELKGKVLEVAQTGYTLNGKIIRYAKVVVAI